MNIIQAAFKLEDLTLADNSSSGSFYSIFFDPGLVGTLVVISIICFLLIGLYISEKIVMIIIKIYLVDHQNTAQL